MAYYIHLCILLCYNIKSAARKEESNGGLVLKV
nr:MAG TPA: hypothetical protein [Caudoviricetes sp.]